jgi:hypothetical protein
MEREKLNLIEKKSELAKRNFGSFLKFITYAAHREHEN